eukprot:3393684-Rhodomonas_salina.1
MDCGPGLPTGGARPVGKCMHALSWCVMVNRCSSICSWQWRSGMSSDTLPDSTWTTVLLERASEARS